VRGLAAGWSEERILATLESASGTPLPQNVRHTIADWAREYERVHLHRDVAIVEAPDPATLDLWLADPALGAGLSRRLTPTVALVRPTVVNEVATVLDQRGVEIWAINYALDPPQVLDLPQPDTVVVTPEDDDPYLRYRLARFAELRAGEDERGATYAISPGSLARAKAQGQSIDETLAFLGYKARTGLSPDDVLTLRGWSGSYQPFQFARVRVVELPPTADWGDLSRVKALRPLILRILTTNLALIAEERWPQLEAALTARGIALHEGLTVQPQAEKRSAAQRAAVDLGLRRRASWSMASPRPPSAPPSAGGCNRSRGGNSSISSSRRSKPIRHWCSSTRSRTSAAPRFARSSRTNWKCAAVPTTSTASVAIGRGTRLPAQQYPRIALSSE
jgi:hypothetical protein